MSESHYSAHLTGEVYNHRLLWHTVESLAARAREQQEGSYHAYLAAALFSYFAFEAFLNFLGDRVAHDAWGREREFFSKDPYRGTYGKLRYLSEACGYTMDATKRPAKSLQELAKARFAVTHARSETIDEVFRAAKSADLPMNKDPVLFAYGEPEFADRLISDVEAVADALLARAIMKEGEDVFPGPRAFQGMIWQQGGHLWRE